MLKLTLIAVGVLKEPWWQEAQHEYLKRLSPFAKVSVVEVAHEPMTDTVTAEQAQEKEAERIFKKIPEDGYLFVMDEQGETFSSKEFAALISTEGDHGQHLVFVIGGSSGVAKKLLSVAHKKISLSEMTLPHEMARVVLLEQLYRATTILSGKKYHY